MKIRKYLGIALIIGTTLCMTGCGEKLPELTQEQYDQTIEFAVGLLLKHSNNGQSRLVYVDAKQLQKERDKAAKADQSTQDKSTQVSTASSSTASSKTTIPSSTSNDDSKTVAKAEQPDNSEEKTDVSANEQLPDEQKQETADDKIEEENSSEESVSDDTYVAVLSAEETQEIEPDIILSYAGYSVSSSFPESSKSYVINAKKGKKLLVLRFDLYNASSSDKKVNMLDKDIMFQVLLNDKNLGYSSVTVLPNDLASFVGTIESKAHESLVVLSEINEKDAGSIQKLGLIISYNGEKQTVLLK